MERKRHPSVPKRYYVIGRRDDDFCWLLSEFEGEQADDQNPDMARHFYSLSEALKIASEIVAGVFEVVQEDGKETLRQILVDRRLAESVPFLGCYRVRDSLIAGPSVLTENRTTTRHRILALANANVRSIVSLVNRDELFWLREQVDQLDFDELFRQHYFPVGNGEAPSANFMRVILDAVDAALKARQIVFVHCVGGRGRTGVAVGCWLARHGVATGSAALNTLTELRFQHGLFADSPESDNQRQLVRQWKKGE